MVIIVYHVSIRRVWFLYVVPPHHSTTLSPELEEDWRKEGRKEGSGGAGTMFTDITGQVAGLGSHCKSELQPIVCMMMMMITITQPSLSLTNVSWPLST